MMCVLYESNRMVLRQSHRSGGHHHRLSSLVCDTSGIREISYDAYGKMIQDTSFGNQISNNSSLDVCILVKNT